MTYIIILITVIISYFAMKRDDIFLKFSLNPYSIVHRKEYFRVISHAFIHADWVHLAVNMFVLWSFGLAVESYFGSLLSAGIINSVYFHYAFLYFGAIVVASLSSIHKYRENFYYNSVGASGAVSAVVFMSIFFAPWHKLYFFGIIPIPGIIFGVLYLVYSQYMHRKGTDNTNHEAHFYGAVYGFIYPLLIDPKLFKVFLNQLMN